MSVRVLKCSGGAEGQGEGNPETPPMDISVRGTQLLLLKQFPKTLVEKQKARWLSRRQTERFA